MMKKILAFSLLAIAFLWGSFDIQAAENPPEPVEKVNLERYMGRWYEIARIPAFFQRKCVGNVMAEYSLLPESSVRVLNSCETANGDRIQSEGRARVIDPKTNAKLRVTFVRLFGNWIDWFGGDYWVIELADDYSYVIVGHPTRKYGWILSRTPMLTSETLEYLIRRLEAQGYDVCKFMTTPQPGGIQESRQLCSQ